MKLYYAPGSCALSPHIVALEAGVEITPIKVNFADKKTSDGKDFNAINPKGYVPALELDNGDVLTEGPAIVQYLADQKPSTLLPAAGLGRYRVIEWLAFINSELHKTFGGLFNPNASDAEKQNAIATLNRRFKYVDEKLAGKQHVTGDAFTVADAYLFVVLSWAGFLKIDLSPYSNLTAFQGRVGGRPKVQEAMRAEGLIK
jgi:glutathione S-transferase